MFGKKKDEVNTVSIGGRIFPLVPTPSRIGTFEAELEKFLTQISDWQEEVVSLRVTSSIVTYPKLLEYIEKVVLDVLYLENTDILIQEILEDQEEAEVLLRLKDLIDSLWVSNHHDFLMVLMGRVFFHQKECLRVFDPYVKGFYPAEPFDWRWIVPYYRKAIPLERQLGLISHIPEDVRQYLASSGGD